jgi:hypothetical protein
MFSTDESVSVWSQRGLNKERDERDKEKHSESKKKKS